MERIEVTWLNAIPVWWSFFWRATLYGGIAGFIAGFIGGFFVAVIGKPELASTVGGVAGYVVAIPVSLWCIKSILNKKYNGYSVCLTRDIAER